MEKTWIFGRNENDIYTWVSINCIYICICKTSSLQRTFTTIFHKYTQADSHYSFSTRHSMIHTPPNDRAQKTPEKTQPHPFPDVHHSSMDPRQWILIFKIFQNTLNIFKFSTRKNYHKRFPINMSTSCIKIICKCLRKTALLISLA